MLFEAGKNRPIVRLARRLSGEHHDIEGRQCRRRFAETFTHQALKAIAGGCLADPAFGDGQAKPWATERIVTEQDGETAIRRAAAFLKDTLKLRVVIQPLFAAKGDFAALSVQG